LAAPQSQKRKMDQMYERLGKVYGKRRRTNFGTTLEQLILTILASEAKEPQALKALGILQEEYVDWNEVRVSPEDVLREDLSGAGVNSNVPALLKRALEGLLLELHTLQPEILDERTPEEVGVILKRIDLPKSLSACLLLTRTASPEDMAVPIDAGVARMMVRAGFAKTARAKSEIDRRIRMLLPPDEVHNFHRVAGRLSQDYCVTGQPNCASCPIRLHCRHYKADWPSAKRSSAMRKSDARLRQTAASRRSRPPSAKR